MKRTPILVFLLVLLSSHELFLKSDSYVLKSNSPAELYLFNGTFVESENIITRDRIIDAHIFGPNYHLLPQEKDYYDNDNITFIKWHSGNPGTYVAGVSTLPRIIKLTASEFDEYLKHEGLISTIEDRKTKGLSEQPATEKYSKHVKAILQVEKLKTNDYENVIGYPIEFIPLSNPYSLSVGDVLVVKLIFRGSPLSNQVVHVGHKASSHNQNVVEKEYKTDQKGELSFTLEEKGKWYVASIYIVESDEEGIDYESNWATLTFEVL
jgi:hypothetical protein